MLLFTPIYRFILYPLSRLGISILALFNGKIRNGLKLRKGKGSKPWLSTDPESQPIWLHCSSGEFEYAKPVIREIKQRWPEQSILVTFFSPSVLSSIQNTPGIDFFTPLPWDTKGEMSEFVEFHKPKALLIARTDLWPMMIHVCKKKKVPTLLFSKTVNSNKGLLAKKIESNLMSQLDDIFCVSENDRTLLAKQLGPKGRTHASGDTRYDQCLHRLSSPKILKPLNNFNRPIFVAGSTWNKDEEVIIPVIKKLGKDISFVIAPHEPTQKHIKTLQNLLQNHGIESCLYSKSNNWGPLEVLIVDEIGILADLYAWGDFAFVGGSMDRSVHSVMEPLAQGCLTFIGPNHTNNREALDFKNQEVNDLAPVQTIKSENELYDKLRFAQDKWSARHKENLQSLVRKKNRCF